MMTKNETNVVFDEELTLSPSRRSNAWSVLMDDNIQVDFEEQTASSERSRKRRRFASPYSMNRNHVRVCNFYDARIYDPEAEAGFLVQPWYARKMYDRWLYSIREIPGWEGFRRAPVLIFQEVEADDGSTFVIRKLVPYTKAKAMGDAVLRYDASKNRKAPHSLGAQSREKGVHVDDENFRPKMFTQNMGSHISQLRNEAKLTQTELAKKINVDAAMMRNIELGGLITFNSEDVMVKALAVALGVPSIPYRE